MRFTVELPGSTAVHDGGSDPHAEARGTFDQCAASDEIRSAQSHGPTGIAPMSAIRGIFFKLFNSLFISGWGFARHVGVIVNYNSDECKHFLHLSAFHRRYGSDTGLPRLQPALRAAELSQPL
jgi:hypothetical protein